MNHKAEGKEIVVAGIAGGTSPEVEIADAPRFHAEFECIGPDGVPKWRTTMKNAVYTEGKAELLNRTFGGKATSGWFMGLWSSNYATASSHRLTNITLSEIGQYGTQRFGPLAFTSTYVSTETTASQTASFGFTAAANLSGAFICNVSATGGTAGVLYSAGGFASSRGVLSNDTLNVTVSLSFA